jgi:hypothetical protein
VQLVLGVRNAKHGKIYDAIGRCPVVTAQKERAAASGFRPHAQTQNVADK